MDFYLFFLFWQFATFGGLAGDPVWDAMQDRRAVREFECDRVSLADAQARMPGHVPATHGRARALLQIDAMVCERRYDATLQRAPRDTAVLDALSTQTADFAALATRDESAPKRWMVEALYPDLTMVRKIAGAQRVALAERGAAVVDEPPMWAAGDVDVFRTMPLRDSVPLACQRAFDAGSVPAGTGVLFVAIAHPEETQLHAGACVDGRLTWLR